MDWKADLKTYFGDNCVLDADMSLYTTYKTGGAAEVLCYPENMEQWSYALKLARSLNVPLHILGGGSNVLASSQGVAGIVCCTRRMGQIAIKGNVLKTQAGAALDKAAEEAVAAGLGGVEKLSGIPGTVGGAVRGNAGAFGQETLDTLEYVEVVDFEGRQRIINKADLKYGYRRVEGLEGCIILSAAFRLAPGDSKELLESRNMVLNKRREKQPLDYPSAGSVFKRPEGDYASRLIDEAGLRGLSIGGAKVSEKHAGFIINYSMAAPEDIYKLMRAVAEKVKEKTGINLELEQILWGDF